MRRCPIIGFFFLLALAFVSASAAALEGAVPVRRPATVLTEARPTPAWDAPVTLGLRAALPATALPMPASDPLRLALSRLEHTAIPGGFRLSAGRGPMASKGASRGDLSGLADVLNPGLPQFNRPLVLDDAALPTARQAFPDRDGLGERRRLHVASNPLAGLTLRSAVALDGSHDVAAQFVRPDASRFDLRASAAGGIDRGAGGALHLGASVAAFDRATGWNGTLAAAWEEWPRAAGPLRVYAKVGRRWRMAADFQAALAVDAGVARRERAEAASVGIAGKLKLADVASLFIGYRAFAARAGAEAGLAQHIVTGARWSF